MQDFDQTQRVEHRSVSIYDLVPSPDNYNQHPQEQLDDLKASLRRFGQVDDVIVKTLPDGTYQIVAHEGVTTAGLQLLEAGECPHFAENWNITIVPQTWTALDVRGYMAASNELARKSVSDDGMLALLLQEQQIAGYPLASMGSDDDTLQQMLADLEEAGEQKDGAGGDDFDITPEDGPTRTHVGELWQLGKHRLLVGDSTKREDVARVMQGEKATLVFTDPPYGVSYVGKTKDALTITSDSMTHAQTQQFLQSAFSLLHDEVLCKGGVFYICSPPSDMQTVFRNALDAVHLQLRQCIVWVKDRFVLGHQDYHNRHEAILHGWLDGADPYRHETMLYGWLDGAAHYFINDRTQDTVWEIDRPTQSKDHPTMKPLELSTRAITNSSRPHDIVFDGFAGSGSTLISCQRTGRVARVIELDPRYADVIVRRYEAETNQTAQCTVEEVAHA